MSNEEMEPDIPDTEEVVEEEDATEEDPAQQDNSKLILLYCM